MARKDTKYCEVLITMLSGVRIRGRFHVEATLSSSLRPSDALREAAGPFLIITHATVHEEAQTGNAVTVLVRGEGISHIQLESKNWVTG